MTISKLLHQATIRILPILFGLFIIGEVFVNESLQWDFKIFYAAAEMFTDGEDPYDAKLLSDRARSPLPFLYPPLTLAIFKVLTQLPIQVALIVWLTLKVLLMAILVLIWQRYFIKESNWWVFGLFVIFAFGGPLSLDIRTGNVSIIEQAFLWSGFAALTMRKYFWFCVLIIVASIFKWTPALFLGLILLTSFKYRWHYFIGSSILFLLSIGLSYLMDPEQFIHFIAVASAHSETAVEANPSLMNLIYFVGSFITKLGVEKVYANYASMVVYLVTISLILSTTVITVRKYWKANGGIRMEYLIITTCLAYALVLPRFKLYSFILLIPVAYYVIKNCYRGNPFWLLLIILCITRDPRYPIKDLIDALWWYYSLFLTYFIWLIWIRFLKIEKQNTVEISVSNNSKT